jgi:hypothetical protein
VVLVSSAVDHVCDSQSGKTEESKISIS